MSRATKRIPASASRRQGQATRRCHDAARTSAATAGCPGVTSAASRSRLASTSMGESSTSDAAAASAACARASAGVRRCRLLLPLCRAAAPRSTMPASVGAAAAASVGRQPGWRAMAPMTSCASGAISGSAVCRSHTCSHRRQQQQQHVRCQASGVSRRRVDSPAGLLRPTRPHRIISAHMHLQHGLRDRHRLFRAEAAAAGCCCGSNDNLEQLQHQVDGLLISCRQLRHERGQQLRQELAKLLPRGRLREAGQRTIGEQAQRGRGRGGRHCRSVGGHRRGTQ